MPFSLLTLGSLLTPLQGVPAQQLGEPVRLTVRWAASTHVTGTLVREDADSFWVQLAGGAAPVSVARSAVGRLEVNRGQKHAVAAGALNGAGLGVIAGFVVGGIKASESRSCGTPDLFTVCYAEWYGGSFRGALIGGAIGGAVGAAVGYAVRSDRWEGVPLSGRLALAPRGAGLALRLAF